MHEIDHRILGDDMQLVEIELDPSEAVIAEAGGMMYMDDGVAMETIFGDGSQQTGGLWNKLVGAGKRVLTGESMFMTVFHNAAAGKKKVAFASPIPGKVLAVHLATLGGELIAQKDSFLAAAKGVSIGIAFQKRMRVGFFGGEGFILQRLQGDGWAFLNACGTLVERELAAGERLRVDTGCVVAFTRGVQYDVEVVSSVKSMLFSGEGLFLTTLTGPGHVWLQSLPFGRLARRIYSAMPRPTGGTRTEEGSLLGVVGGLLDGDNN